MAQLRGVGIGAGYFSRFHYEAWTRIPEVAMSAVCDTVEEKARAAAAHLGTDIFYTDWRKCIDRERPDFVDIITPPATHQEICEYAASRGIHIACQKPLAPTYGEAEAIVDNARRSSVRFMVHENWRWQPWYREVARIRSENSLGRFTHLLFLMRTGDGWGDDAYLSRQPFFREYPRLLVFETAVHFIDTFRFLLGEVKEVYANLRRLNPVIRGEDTAQIFFHFDSGATAILDANRYNESEAANPRFTFGEMRIDATEGHVEMNTAGDLRIKRLGEQAYDLDYPHEDVNFAGDCVYRLQRHFTDCMLSGDGFESSGEDYLQTIRVVEAVYESAAQRAPVSLVSPAFQTPFGQS